MPLVNIQCPWMVVVDHFIHFYTGFLQKEITLLSGTIIGSTIIIKSLNGVQ